MVPSGKEALKIVIPEDNPVNQLVAVKILEKLGYKADVAENCQLPFVKV